MSAQVPLTLDYSYLLPDVSPDEMTRWQGKVTQAHTALLDGSGAGSDFRGWMDPETLMPPSS